MSRALALLLALTVARVAAPAPARADDPPAFDAAALEFFEKEVRPILVARCLDCHGAAKQKSELRLDSRAAALAGGLTGPAVVPGDLDESLLVEAIRYGDTLKMPPKSKLPDAEVAVLTKWITLGAPWPPEAAPAAAGAARKPEAFDLTERAQHWSFQPLQAATPPAVRDPSRARTPIDRFVLAGLDAAGVAPAPEADRRTLIRRLAFDLTGLPPTVAEVEAFAADDRPDAYERLVDRLLASPAYGERWGRHWLDLVRYGETAGHEFDYDIPNAWRYRDYVVRAFNADVPYPQFVLEHLAGDLLPPEQRRRRDDGSDESVLGTGFFALGEGTHSPVDVREEQARRIDNQLEVLSKTFLGLTVACARCHDHKFDPIAQRDYYALAGYLKSSRHQQAFLDAPEVFGRPIAELDRLKVALKSATTAAAGDREAQVQRLARAIGLALAAGGAEPPAAERVDPALLKRWVEALKDPQARTPGHPLSSLLVAATPPTPEPAGPAPFARFDGADLAGWGVTGPAFADRPTPQGAARVTAHGLAPVPPGLAHSGLASDRLSGVLRSPTFTITQKFIATRAWGKGGRLNVIVDGFEKNRDPIYGGLTVGIDSDRPRWYVQDVTMWLGHRAYLEIADGGWADFGGGATRIPPGDGFVAVDTVRFSDTPAVPPDATPLPIAAAPDAPAEARALAFAEAVVAGQSGWLAGEPVADGAQRRRIEALGWLVERGLIPPGTGPAAAAVAERLAGYRAIEAALPAPTLAPALLDGPGEDEFLLARGNPRTPTQPVPRRFLEVFAGPEPSTAGEPGSGRLALARRIVDPAQTPLPSRVIVNRLWQHHFGRGIVPTPDDFGHMGQAPSDPALLDWLAHELSEQGGSLKALHRQMVTSATYRRSSRPTEADAATDPDNRLLHRANLRRLEAESLRDAMLAVSGALAPKLGGPSVAPHVTAFMDGRGRPGQSGPLDGDGRRTLYLNVRRNFLNPMLLAFDFPAPFTTIGRRNVSNVPAQALTLLNDPFVLEQSRRWAARLIAEGGPAEPPAERVDRMYRAAFGRPPEAPERAAALAFLGPDARPDDPAAWADLAHVLFNVKAFLFVD